MLVEQAAGHGELLWGSLLERTVRHTKECCAWRGASRVSADHDLRRRTDAAVRSVALAPNTDHLKARQPHRRDLPLRIPLSKGRINLASVRAGRIADPP